MRKNMMKELLKGGRVVVGTWIDLEDPHFVEIMGYIGFDFVVLEHEHVARDLSRLEQLIVAADVAQIPSIVRIRDLNTDLIGRILGAGATGLVLAHIQTKEDALKLVRAAKYPPIGSRGMHPSLRSTQFGTEFGAGFEQYAKEANEQITLWALIEEPMAVDNVDEIASVEGLDGLFYGPGDLSMQLGIAGQWEHPKLLAMRDKIVEAARKHNKWLWFMADDPEYTESVIEQGANVVAYGHDFIEIRLFYEGVLKTMRAVVASYEKKRKRVS